MTQNRAIRELKKNQSRGRPEEADHASSGPCCFSDSGSLNYPQTSQAGAWRQAYTPPPASRAPPVAWGPAEGESQLLEAPRETGWA